MIIKYGFNIDLEAINVNIRRLINKIFKLLPSREENGNWQKELDIVIEEIRGMDELLLDQRSLFELLCLLEGLRSLTAEKDFFLYRRTVFECLSLLDGLKNSLESDYGNSK